MKKFLQCSSVLLMLALAGTSFADEHFPLVGEVKGRSVNIRAGANTNFEIVDKLSKGDEVAILGKTYEWYKVRLPATADVYIRADYINQVGEGLDGEVLGNKVNLRVRPNAESSTLGQVSKGERVHLISKQNDWWKIEPPVGSFGWMHQDLVTPKAGDVNAIVSRKPAAPKSVPAAVVEPVAPVVYPIDVKGQVKEIAPTLGGHVHYVLLIDGKPAYYLKDAPHLGRFNREQVHVQGSDVTYGQASPYPLLRVDNISLIL